MINQYRTLLLNQTDSGNSNEYIAPQFNAFVLPQPLSYFYNLLFPNNVSRYYIQFLAYCYLQLIRAANQEQFVYSLDNRITYQLENINDYFLIDQISSPIISNSDFPISLFGKYGINSTNTKNYEDILISQLSTIYVSIFSKTNNVFYNQTSSSSNLTPEYQVKISSNLMNMTSDTINIANTGLSFLIAGSLIDLSESSNLSWEFIAQAPYTFDFNSLYQKLLANLPTVNAMLNYNSSLNDPNSLSLWSSHYNPVYRFAGLLNCYVLQINGLK